MKVFYTKTYNMGGKNAQKQAWIERVASRMGYEEISFFKFPDETDSDTELDVRIEGIMAAVDTDAVVVFQYPGMISARYDRAVIRHLKKYRNRKLIIMVEDLGSMLQIPGYPDLKEEIELFQQADVLVLQSAMMKDYLVVHGLRKIPVLYQELWEFPYEIYNRDVRIEKRLQTVMDLSVPALIGMRRCGIACPEKRDGFYYEMCNPLEAGFCICAGIPLLAEKNSGLGKFISRYGIGVVAGEQNEAQQIVSALTQEQIRDRKRNLMRLQPAVGSGMFTQTLLQNAVYRAFTDSFL